jgi:hypothetical protein
VRKKAIEYAAGAAIRRPRMVEPRLVMSELRAYSR